MKVAAILEDTITVGGGFNQALNSILQIREICTNRFEFEVYTTHTENIDQLALLGLKATLIKYNIIDRCFAYFPKNLFLMLAQHHLGLISPFEAKLLRHNVDLVYFLTNSITPAALTRLNYILTVFDLCHRDYPEFPEIGNSIQFLMREQRFKNNLYRAVLVVTDSEKLSRLITKRYGIDDERLLIMPFSPSPFLESDVNHDKNEVLDFYQLSEGYFYYPAQFWAHKNHIRILEALLLLKEKGIDYKVVFTGRDKGNYSHILKFVSQHGLGGQVRFLGFVPAEHIRGLYEGCRALVMPTYFGPTNLPPLEAWTLRKPVIYSAHLREQAGEAAIYFNPDEPLELADAMQVCVNPNVLYNLGVAGSAQLKQITAQRVKSETEFLRHLEKFAAKRRCWA
jgi:glycosyltransferase involved in cell wall biosynthesis